MLGFDISERTISRWMKRAQRNAEPARRWLAFLRNHREAIAAMDFLTVPTITFGLLYCFSIIGHGQSAPRFLIFDRDAKYGLEVPIAVRSMAIRPVRTSFQSLVAKRNC
jgi:hypothetical protein